MSQFTVQFAVYGALKSGNEEKSCTINVKKELQDLLNQPDRQGEVKIDNATLGCDPSPGDGKHFGAIVNDHYFACAEGQTIDFNHYDTQQCPN